MIEASDPLDGITRAIALNPDLLAGDNTGCQCYDHSDAERLPAHAGINIRHNIAVGPVKPLPAATSNKRSTKIAQQSKNRGDKGL